MMESFIFESHKNMPYGEGLLLQESYFNELLSQKKEKQPCQNHLLFCEHQPVITIGKSGKDTNLLVSEELLQAKGIDLYHITRGGDITYHGPGQITGYPIFDIEQYNMGLRTYIETLEEIMIKFLFLYGLKGERLDGATGVWLDPESSKARKICAIGVKSSRFVTMHGFALNINTDLEAFRLINPCGFIDKGVTSLAKEVGEKQDFDLAQKRLRNLFALYFPKKQG